MNNHKKARNEVFYLGNFRRYKRDDGIYHVIVRAVSEIQVFQRDKDQEIYLSQMKYYKENKK